ncbi:FG-GAP-like repeat-containing protein [Luteimonas composti]|uniref:FG-GAP-like repeat-containing protein n=1 Tax=Luteimonas composti TaxID=398257 RepID=A0ABT6MTY5_9GAMM|nr:FG-GAP-like repeat-containing protein [Luteimonas composti]MDH7454082.1 FG-GAP-like repeat-containing protein [Luteimonas composti]
MRKHLLGLMLIAGMAGCTSESGVAPADNPGDTTANGPDAAPTAASLAATRGSTSSFASLPDRGELLAYGGVRKARKEGAYTWHPVSISEEHALNAIGGGRMVVNTPDGQALDLRYERHEEQPDGNWSWIGRSEDGASAVLTFGEKAVFGSIARGDAQYRVRTDRSGAWMVETDPRLVAANGGRPKEGTDVLMPPESRALAAAASRQLAAKAGTADAPPAKALAVVDVLLGYSSTIASELGSQAAAVTLVSNLAAAANAAYVNSGVNMRLRVVHAMSVNYADTTRNRDALQQLTGYNVDTQQPITPNSAFNALRAARNEYGADLVAFVRRYREPEQDGCGIAWLLGMNNTAIDADDEAFGYAVVSDGSDRDESDNNTYFCSQYSLAHELGHLMGQAHDEENADDAGVHPYSYGYRETSSTGFFTIMAYPASGTQIEAPHFANPAVRFSGRATGNSAADNVRSMNQTMPIISQFRATVVPLRGVKSDVDGDGKSDVLFRNSSNGRNLVWKSANYATQQAMTAVASQAWRVVGVGDFNNDGKADVLWRNASTGANTIWRSASYSDQQSVTAVTNLNWRVAGVGDFNGDGVSDILWRRNDTGRNVIWLAGRGNSQVNVTAVTGGGWDVVGVGDFNGDGRADILWRSSTTGKNTIWRSGSGSASNRQDIATVSDRTWRVVGVGDFNGDGVDDILWRNTGSGANTIWLGGNSATRQAVTSVNLRWVVAAVGDYDGDGRSDILWRHSTDGRNVIWKSGNSATQQAMTRVADLAWRIVP